MTQLDHTQTLTNIYHLFKESFEFLKIVFAKVANGAKIRSLPTGQVNIRYTLIESFGNLSGTKGASGIGIDEDLKHHLRVIARMSLGGNFLVEA